MATIKSSLILKDRFSNVLRNVNRALNGTSAAANTMQSRTNRSLQRVNKSLDGLGSEATRAGTKVSGAADKISSSIHKINGMSGKLSRSGLSSATTQVRGLQTQLQKAGGQATNTGKQFDNMKNRLKGIASSVGGIGANLGGWIYSIKEGTRQLGAMFEMLDNISNQTARSNILGTMFDVSGADIQKKVKIAASTVGAEYGSMLNDVSKMGIMTDGLFSNEDQLIAFNTQLQKMYTIAGAGQAQIDSASLQLTQALAAGALRGEEFNAIFEAAPNIIQQIAKYMGVTTGEMKNLASEGAISAEVVKNAILGSSEEVNSLYAQMPMSFRNVLNQILSDVNTYLGPVAAAFSTVWTVVLENWNWVGRALMIGVGIFFVFAAAIAIATGAVWLFNLSLWANPITWVIAVIVALIGMLVMLAGVFIYLWQTNLEFKYNILTAWTEILNFFSMVPSYFYTVASGIINAFVSAATGTMEVMQDMANGVIRIINDLINTLNRIPGVALPVFSEITAATKIAARAEAGNQQRKAQALEVKNHALQTVQERNENLASEKAADAARLKKNKGKDGFLGLGNIGGGKPSTSFLDDQFKNIPSYGDLPASAKGAAKGGGGGAGGAGGGSTKVNGGKLDSIGSIEDNLSFSDENIKLLKDIATRKITNNYTKLKPNLKVKFGDVRETADVKKVLEAVEKMVEEAYHSSLATERK